MSRKDIDPFFIEEDFHKRSKKELKKKRKILSKKDKSKYKKTNVSKNIIPDQLEKNNPLNNENIYKGRVISIKGEKATVSYNDKNYLCSTKGSLKKEFSKDKNILAVGDIVYFEITNDTDGHIIQIDKRYSELSRKDLVRNKKQIIAVNIDQVLITVSVVKPFLKPALIDRYIIASEKGNMTPIIVINKIDLLNNKEKLFPPEEIYKEKKLYKDIVSIYKEAGYTVISVSAETKKGISALKKVMKNKTSVFSGQSGTGKTSLINQLFNLDFVTKQVVKKTYKGAHTTTKATLIPLGEESFCIDTPGIKSFGIWELNKQEIQNHFPEFEKFKSFCKYPNCMHIDEPMCAVKKAAENREISPLRYNSYLTLVKNTEQKDFNR